MKANELMVGDYVMCQSIKEKYARITEIYFTLDEKPKRMVALNARGARYCVPIDNIETITLTPEILEKNGFVVESRHCHGNPLQYCVLVDGLWIDISGENYFEGKLEYVHQLQHALRLCGITREIIL